MRKALFLLGLAGCGGDAMAPDAEYTLPDAAPVAPTVPEVPAMKRHVRFIAVGDTGKGNEGQRQVAAGMRKICETKGCDFVLLLGDNIYDRGVTSTTDAQWQSKFEAPYADLHVPFYAVLGNHDYGGSFALAPVAGLGNDFERGAHEIAYSQVSTKWRMPASHYTFNAGHVGFIAVDSNALMWDDKTNGDQLAWIDEAKAQVAGQPWKIVVGHHPYRSNGNHGNAGEYDDQYVWRPEALTGSRLKAFYDEHVCGMGQVYLSGHDHSRQWIEERNTFCGMKMLVSGAGAEVTKLRDRNNTTLFEDASKVGFAYIDINEDTFTGQFYDASAKLDFERSFQR